MTNTESLITYLKGEVAELPDAPEAIEFWQWIPVQRTLGHYVEVDVMPPSPVVSVVEDLSKQVIERQRIIVHVAHSIELAGERYRLGWNTNYRIVVAWIL